MKVAMMKQRGPHVNCTYEYVSIVHLMYRKPKRS